MNNQMNLRTLNKILTIMKPTWVIMLKQNRNKKIHLSKDMTKPVLIMKVQSLKNLRH